MTQSTILLFIPCYRCADQIGRVIDRLSAARLPGIGRVLVVDNGSPDGTVANAAEALGRSAFTDWQVVVNDRNVSLGGSHKVAFAHARENGFSHVLIVHGDDQAEPKNFRLPLEAGAHLRHDAVLGSRFMANSQITGYGRFRIFGNHVFNTLFRLATRRPILDLGSGLNIYGPAILAAEDERPACDDLTFHCDLLITMIERGRDLHYVPVDWREDDQVSNAKLVRQSWRILKILAAHAMGRPAPAGPGKNVPAEAYTSTVAARSHRQEVRTDCAVCGSARLHPTGVRFPLPAYQGCVATHLPDAVQMRPTMAFDVCEDCGSAQIVAPLPPEIVYQGGHATGLGGSWAQHHAALSRFLQEHSTGPILEYGGGAGTLARTYRAREPGETRPWTIVEPNPVTSGDPVPDLRYEIGFFGPESRIGSQTGTVLFCHCLEHLPSIRDAARHLAGQLAPGRRVVVAWPDLERWIEKGVPGALNWEHTFYCTIPTLEAVFAREGFALAAHESFGPGHSHFLAFERDPGCAAPESTEAVDPGRTIARLREYFGLFRQQAEALNGALAGRPYYLAPASIYGQALRMAGLAPNCRGLVDNAAIKQGRTLYGTGLIVEPPSVLKSGDVLVLNGGAHAAEMARGFLERVPDLTILHADQILSNAAGKAA